MKGTPWEPTPGKTDDAIPVRVRLPEEGETTPSPNPGSLGEPAKDNKRRARITREDVVRVGFTINCPGCKAISRNAPPQNHTEACRTRIEQALLKEGGNAAKRIAEGTARYETHIAKRRQLGGASSSQSIHEDEPSNEDKNHKRSSDANQEESTRQSDDQPKHKQHKKNESAGNKRERDPDAKNE